MSPFIIVRVFALVGFLAFAGTTLFWMYTKNVRLRAIPLLGGALHGTVFYSFYLFFYFYPDLTFDLQLFSNWGAVFLLQVAWTGVLITLDLATDFFSGHILPWFFDHVGGRGA